MAFCLKSATPSSNILPLHSLQSTGLLGTSILPSDGAAKIAAFWLRQYVDQTGSTDIVDMIHSYSAEQDSKKLAELLHLANTTERYEDMCKFAKKLVEIKSARGEDLAYDERELLCVAYKSVVGPKRTAWRTLVDGFEDGDEELVQNYKTTVESELEPVCNEVLDLLKEHLYKNVKGSASEAEVFYLKMCGDYYRYLAEFVVTPKDKANEIKNNARRYYKEAMDMAEANLGCLSPTRLGVALNFSVCYYEILKEPEKACDLAKRAFHLAMNQEPKHYQQDQLQLLRDNITLWTSNQDERGDQ